MADRSRKAQGKTLCVASCGQKVRCFSERLICSGGSRDILRTNHKSLSGGFEHGGGSQLLSSKLRVALLRRKTLSVVNKAVFDPCPCANPFLSSPVCLCIAFLPSCRAIIAC